MKVEHLILFIEHGSEYPSTCVRCYLSTQPGGGSLWVTTASRFVYNRVHHAWCLHGLTGAWGSTPFNTGSVQ